MGLLQDTIAYLCGPIESQSKQQSEGWRIKLANDLLDLGIISWDPLRKPHWADQVDGKAQREIKRDINTYLFHDYDLSNPPSYATAIPGHAIDITHELRLMGLRLAAACDFVICYLPATFTVGTFEELNTAKTCNKPMFLWVPDKLPSTWLLDQFPTAEYFCNKEDLLNHLRRIDNNEFNLDPIKWIFLSWSKHADKFRPKIRT